MVTQKRYILAFLLLFYLLQACAPKKTNASKLSTIFKDKLLAYDGNLTYKLLKLKKGPNQEKDTIIKSAEWQFEKHNFFKLLEETNYYNLDLISIYSHVIALRPASDKAPDEIVMSDPKYNYRKKPQRKLCDEYIVLHAKQFNEIWGSDKAPKKIKKLVEYYTYKKEIINYLILNGCY